MRKSQRKKEHKPSRNFDFNGKGHLDAKVTQLGLHLETLFERGVNFKERIITINGEITENTFQLIDSGLSEMESASRKSITIRINSGGGSVYDALAIVGRLRASKCKIITEGFGHIMSAACLILACGNYRKVSTFSWFMTHEASYDFEGKHTAHKNLVVQAEREENQWAKWMAEFTKKDSKFWKNISSSKDTYFTPEELLQLGVIDEVV